MAHGEVLEIKVPAKIAPLGLLDRVDYQDAFSTRAVTRRAPEELLRDVLEGAPDWFLQSWSTVIFKGALGLILDMEHSPDRIAGWRIVADTGNLIAIGFDSPRGAKARLFATISNDTEIVGTLAQLDSLYARSGWPLIRLAHRFFLPYLLRQSAERADRIVKNPND